MTWGCAAFDADGKACDGSVTNELGTRLELYKNWAYLFNDRLSVEGDGFAGSAMCSIDCGEMQVAGYTIHAKRGLQSSIYILARYGKWDEPKYFAGIGCYGFANTAKIVLKEHGREREYNDSWFAWSSYQPGVGEQHFVGNAETGENIEYEHKEHHNVFIGVEPDTLADFFAWLEELVNIFPSFTGWLQKCKDNTPKHFNQGDAVLGADNNSVVGEQPSEPVVTQLMG